MKSNKRLFSKTVFVSNLKRFWPFSIPLAVIELVVFPLIMLSSFDIRNPLDLEGLMPFSIAYDVLAFLFAGVMALLMFSYLFSANKCNALHAFPIGRKALFTTNVFSGYLLLIVPQLLGFCGVVPVMVLIGKGVGQMVMFQLTSIVLDSLIFYSVGVLAAMLAGNLFAGGIIYLVLHFAYATLVSMGQTAITTLGWGLYYDDSNYTVASLLSPMVRLTQLKSQPVFVGMLSSEPEQAFDIVPIYTDTAIYAVAAVAVVVIAWLLYKVRALECAGDMVAYKAEIPVLSILIGIGGGYYTAQMLTLFLYNTDFVAAAQAGSFVVFTLIFFFGAQMILRKSAKVFRWQQFLLWGVTCAVCIGAVWSIANYRTNYLPPAGKVASAKVNCTYEMNLTEAEDIAAAEELHQLLIDAKDAVQTENHLREDYYDSYYDYWSPGIYVTYTLQNGKTVTRYYDVSPRPTEVQEKLNALELANPPQSVFEMLADYDIQVISCEVEDCRNSTSRSIYLKTEELEPYYQLCAAEAHQQLEGYTSANQQRFGNECFYIAFECTVEDKDQLKALSEKLKENNDYISDPAENSIEMDYLSENRIIVTVNNPLKNGEAEAYIRQIFTKG